MKTFNNNIAEENTRQPKANKQAPVHTILNDYSNTIQCVSSSQVMQMKWIKVRGTLNDYYWDNDSDADMKSLPKGAKVVSNPHTPIDDRAGIAKKQGSGGFFMPGGTDRMITMHGSSSVSKGTAFDPSTAQDTTNYFGGSLQIHHRGEGIQQQSIGAPLPAAPTTSGPSLAPVRETAWWQDEPSQLPQTTPRGNEKTIMGESANDALSRSGIAPQPYAPFAHIQPDHTHPADREDRSLRHPTYEPTNQVHSAIETGVKGFVNNNGGIGVGRQQVGALPGSSGLYAGMNMQLAMPTPSGFHFLNHYQPHFSSTGGRSGDAPGITRFLELEHYKQAASGAGIADEEMAGTNDDYNGEKDDDAVDYSNETELFPDDQEMADQ